MKLFIKASAILLVTLSTTSALHAEVKQNSLFDDNAVLQRDCIVPVWGTARDGEKITVEFAGQKISTVAKDGKWMVRLKPLQAGGPLVMTIVGDNTITLTNILVGDVWVAGGQSNMERPLGAKAIPDAPAIDNAQAEIAAANYPEIRVFTVPLIMAFNPVADANGQWEVCSPETVPHFSAVGYFFARDLQQTIKVPVGLLCSYWGGSLAAGWTSANSLRKIPGYAGALSEMPQDSGGTPKFNAPTVFYNAMIAPLQLFPIKGVIWYQGEADNFSSPKQYRTLFPLLIADWRQHWHEGKFPFLFVQIAPNQNLTPEIREAQFLTLQKSPNTAMAVITDAGDAINGHPSHKQVVGERLALAARALAYGEKIEYSGPLFDSIRVENKEAILFFTHIGSGLVAKGGDLKGFTVAGEDKTFVPAHAEIQGDEVIVTSDEVTKPVAVRYGWDNVPDVNLYNKEGLPASPFRTDLPE